MPLVDRPIRGPTTRRPAHLRANHTREQTVSSRIKFNIRLHETQRVTWGLEEMATLSPKATYRGGKIVTALIAIAIWAVLILFGLWAAGGWYYHPLVPAGLRWLAWLAFAGVCLAFYWHPSLRPHFKLLLCGLIVLTYLVWLPWRPKRDANWTPNHARQATFEIDGDWVTIHNLRHTVYDSESDYQTQYRERKFRMAEVQGIWFAVQRFTSMDWLAHTFLCFEVHRPEGVEYFAVSVEVRCEEDESYSPFHGMYRHYELLYTISDERDGIGFRTVTRPDDRVYLFRCNATPAQSQRVLLDIMARTNRLSNRPEFYHTLLNNCTNNLVKHANQVVEERINLFDLRVMLPGWSGHQAHRLELIGAAGESYAELESRSRVDILAKEIPLDENFSQKLREALAAQAESRSKP